MHVRADVVRYLCVYVCDEITSTIQRTCHIPGADLNLADKAEGYTALHWACVAGDYLTVKTVLGRGADPTVKSFKTDQTALDIVEKTDNDDITELINWHSMSDNMPCHISPHSHPHTHINAPVTH